MLTRYRVYRPGLSTFETREVDLPKQPSYSVLACHVEPILNGYLEHLSVLFEGRRADMFVDDEGRMKGLARNEEATKIYRAYMTSTHPGIDPETLNYIVGIAVVFERIVWY